MSDYAKHLKDQTAFNTALKAAEDAVKALKADKDKGEITGMDEVTKKFEAARAQWDGDLAEAGKGPEKPFKDVICGDVLKNWTGAKLQKDETDGAEVNPDVKAACEGSSGMSLGIILAIVGGVVVIGGGLAFYCLCMGKSEDADEEESGEDE